MMVLLVVAAHYSTLEELTSLEDVVVVFAELDCKYSHIQPVVIDVE